VSSDVSSDVLSDVSDDVSSDDVAFVLMDISIPTAADAAVVGSAVMSHYSRGCCTHER
jgi:hypothetical protein